MFARGITMPRTHAPRALLICAIALVPIASLVDAGAQPKAPTATSASAPPASSAKLPPPPVGSASTGSGVGAPKLAPAAKAGPPPKPEDVWVAATTDEFITQLEKRAIRDGVAGGKNAIGAIMAIPQLADEARGGLARASLGRIATA